MDSISVGGRTATVDEPLRCAVFLSGSGSGMEALVHAQRNQTLLHQTVVVVANKTGIEGLERARRLGVPTLVVEQNHEGGSRSREEHEAEILSQMKEYNVELVVLAGYMRLLSPLFLSDWTNRVVNIHPSFLPHFPGAHAHREFSLRRPPSRAARFIWWTKGWTQGPSLLNGSCPCSRTMMSRR